MYDVFVIIFLLPDFLSCGLIVFAVVFGYGWILSVKVRADVITIKADVVGGIEYRASEIRLNIVISA